MTKTAQKTINVGTPFTLIINEQGKQPRTLKIEAGVQKVDEDVAEHWYTKVHLANGGLGTVEYAKATRASADAAFVKAKALIDEYDGLEQAAQEAEAEAGLDPVAPTHERLGGQQADEPEEEEVEEVEAPDLTEMSADDLRAWLTETGYTGPDDPQAELPALLETAQAWQASRVEAAEKAATEAANAKAAARAPARKPRAKKP